MSTLSPISESRESLSGPADGSDRTQSPVSSKQEDNLKLPESSPQSARSHSPGLSSISQLSEDVYSFELCLQVKMKIADRPLRSFISTR